jgi:hypothetical protein
MTNFIRLKINQIMGNNDCVCILVLGVDANMDTQVFDTMPGVDVDWERRGRIHPQNVIPG